MLLADEPSAHRDAGFRDRVWEQIGSAAAAGTACLIATHEDEAAGFAASQGLTVQLTLFDWLHENEYADIAGWQQWAHDLLAPYAGDRRIEFVEVRNERNPNTPRPSPGPATSSPASATRSSTPYR